MSKKYSIGIDIGGTNTELGLVNKNGDILYKSFLITKYFDDSSFFLSELTRCIIELIEKCDDKDNIQGIGIGAPNANYYNGTIEHAPNLNFKGIIPVKEIIENNLSQKGFYFKVSITNDANAAAIGEMVYGGAKGINNFLMITLGTGVGSGIVIDGKLFYGHDGFAGEVGHTIILPEGRQCSCGRRGCLETYSSVTGIKKTTLELIKRTKTPSILRKFKSDDIGGKTIYDAAIKGDKLALKCYDTTARILAIGLANTVTVTPPEKIFLFGGLTKSGDLLIKPLQKYFEEYLFVIFKNKIDIEISHLNEENAAILGAAALTY